MRAPGTDGGRDPRAQQASRGELRGGARGENVTAGESSGPDGPTYRESTRSGRVWGRASQPLRRTQQQQHSAGSAASTLGPGGRTLRRRVHGTRGGSRYTRLWIRAEKQQTFPSLKTILKPSAQNDSSPDLLSCCCCLFFLIYTFSVRPVLRAAVTSPLTNVH